MSNKSPTPTEPRENASTTAARPRFDSAPRALFVRFAPWMARNNNHPHDLMWPVSMLYGRKQAELAGWRAEIIDLHVEDLGHWELVERIQRFRPDLLLLDTMTPTMKLSRQVATTVASRMPETKIWGVGQHASELSNDLIYAGSPYTGVLLGEYECALPHLLQQGGHGPVEGSIALTKDGTQHVQGPKQKVSDLDALPAVDPRGLLLDRYGMRSTHTRNFGRTRWGFLMTSRGCPFLCTFCSPTLRQSYGRGFRTQSALQVVDDMERLHRDHGIDAYYLIDDIFSFDKERVRNISRELIRRKVAIQWVIQTRPDMIDPETLRLLKLSGCTGVKMGVESGVDRILKLVKKGVRRDKILESARQIRAAGLSLTAYYMLGHPTETLEEMEETFRFAKEVKADMIQVAFHTPYPGSESYEMYKREVSDLSELNHYETYHVNQSEVDGGTLEKMQRNFYLKYYFSPDIFLNYLTRRAVFRLTDPGEWRLAFKSVKYLLMQRTQQQEGGQTEANDTEEVDERVKRVA